MGFFWVEGVGAPQWPLGFVMALNIWDLAGIMEIKGGMWFIIHPFLLLFLLVLLVVCNMPTLY